MSLTSIFSFGYQTNNIVEYALHIDFQYIIDKVEGRQLTLTFADNSIRSKNANPTRYDWIIKHGSNIIYTGNSPIFTTTIELTREIVVEYKITTEYGVSELNRTLYFNTYPTINALLARTTTAISKAYNGNNYKLLSIDADEYDMIYSSMRELMKSGYVKYATGISLDYLGAMWKVYREEAETDDQLRARIVQTITAENVQISKQGLLDLISASFGLDNNGIELVEREQLPDYSWGTSVGGSDMLPYDNSYRPAEFTFYLKNGPIFPTKFQYVTDVINQARACGVFFNSVKVTIVADLTDTQPINVELESVDIYDEIIIDEGQGWGDDKWGSSEEVVVKNNLNPSFIYTKTGKWIIAVSSQGDNQDYKTKEFEIFESINPKWGLFNWGSLW